MYMATEIGSKGLAEVNIVLPQSTSLTFNVVHKDDGGDVVDHSASTANMAFQSKDKKVKYDLDDCVTCSSDAVYVAIPASVSENLPLGKLNWDMIVTTQLGEQTRLCYGTVTVVDTYALDGD